MIVFVLSYGYDKCDSVYDVDLIFDESVAAYYY